MKEIPASCLDYITKTLGRTADVTSSRTVTSAETSRGMSSSWRGMTTVGFYGRYEARRPLADHEDAYDGNAVRVGWECEWDAEDWPHSVARFKNAPASVLLAGG